MNPGSKRFFSKRGLMGFPPNDTKKHKAAMDAQGRRVP